MPRADSGTIQINLNYDWNNLKTLKSGDIDLNDDTRQRETHSVLLEFGYSFSSKLALDVFVPFIRQERTITTFGPTNFQATDGLGDIVILPKYSPNDHFTIGAGVKLPTGNPDSFSEQGIALPADLQAGSGALDGILFFSYQQSPRSRPSLSYISTAIFRYTGTNEEYFAGNSYRFGNELQVSLAAADRLFVGGLVIDPSIGIQYRKRGRDFFDGGEFPGSGGDFLFLNPGISTPINQKFSWQVNVSLPLYSKVVDTQLAPTLQLNMGISFKTNLKSDNKFLGI